MQAPTRKRTRSGLGAAALFAGLLSIAAAASAEQGQVRREREVIEPSSIGVEDHLGKKIPLELSFTDERGERRELRELVSNERPVMVMLVYYECPGLCSLTLNGFVDAAKRSRYRIGEDYDVLTISIDPGEGPELAAAKKESYIDQLGEPGAAQGWHWLTGDKDQIETLAAALGFKYRYDPVQDEYAHPACVHVLTPSGRLSRNLVDVQFEPKDFDLALLEASNGSIAKGLVERIALVCYRYDPEARGYVLSATRVMQLGGVVILVCIAGLLGVLWLRERRRAAATTDTNMEKQA